jgi:Family of unknown function (DUF6127)
MSDDEMITMPRDDYEEIISRAVTRGVTIALREIGIDPEDKETVRDLQDGLGIVRSLKRARASALQTIWQMIVKAMFFAFLVVLMSYFGIKIPKMLGMNL